MILLMVETGISRRLVDFAMVLLGRMSGAPAQGSIATDVFFAGVIGPPWRTRLRSAPSSSQA